MENKNNINKNSNEALPEIEFLDEIEYETDIEEMAAQKKTNGKRKTASSNKTATSKHNSSSKNGTNKSSNRKKVKKSSKFKRGMLIYVAALAVLIIGVWIFFFSFIDGYEKGMSYNKIDQVATQLNKDGINTLFDNVDAKNEFESKSAIEEYVSTLVGDKEITYKESKETTPDEPVYELCVDKKPFAKVYLKQDGYIKHHFKNWVVASVDFADYLPSGSSVVVLAPEDSSVYINDTLVSDDYIKESSVTVNALTGVEQYLTKVPTEKKYEVTGFINTPTVTVKDSEGNELAVTEKEGVFEAGYSTDEATENEFAEYVGDVTYAYARNFANLGRNIFNYILPNSDLYASIESATTYFYPDSKISGTEFTSREITDFVRYSQDCFTCHVKYQYTIYFSGYTIDKDVSEVDMIWTFVNKDGLWYLTNTKYY